MYIRHENKYIYFFEITFDYEGFTQRIICSLDFAALLFLCDFLFFNLRDLLIRA